MKGKTAAILFAVLAVGGFFTWGNADSVGVSAAWGNFMEVAGIVMMVLSVAVIIYWWNNQSNMK